MRFCELLSRAGLESPATVGDMEVSGIVTDSRKVTKNCIFVCIRGTLMDGHDHIDEAIEAGAAVIVAENVRGVCVGGAAIILVENTRLTASLLYNVWYGCPTADLKIIGVTGTNGKTSTALMLLQIFESAGYPCGFLGTVGYMSVNRQIIKEAEMTTPDPETLYSALARMKHDDAEYVFMEVSSHSLVQGRVGAINFDTAVFTNLSEDHLDFHKDMEAYYKAKQILFTQCRRAVINTDDAAGKKIYRFLENSGVERKSCSIDKGDFCALFPKAIGSLGSEYALKTANGMYKIFLPLLGEFQIMNSLQAVAVALMHGIPIERVRSAIGAISGISGRMEMLSAHEKQNFTLIIDYAHTPDALQKLLRSVKEIKDDRARTVLLFGCGGEREKEKRKIMGQIASSLADLVIVTSDNPRGENPEDIIRDILKGIDKEKAYCVIENRKEAIEAAVAYTRKGDVLVLAGKGHESYQIDSSGKHAFDEREIVREALKKLYDK